MLGRSTFAAVAVLISLCQVGQAQILYGGPLYGGASAGSGGSVSCNIFNFSSAAVDITQRRIFAHNGAAVVNIFDSCNVPLGRLKSCSFGGAATAQFLQYSCRAVYSGTAPKLSGVMLIIKNNEVMQQIPMQSASQ